MNDFLDHPGVKLLVGLGLPRADFAVAGSGPLFARGWIGDPSDVDVIARGAAWSQICQLGPVEPAPFSTVQRVRLFDSRIEILDGWFPEIWEVDRLIDDADIIEDIRFVQIAVIAQTKRILHRPRDESHLDILRKHGVTV